MEYKRVFKVSEITNIKPTEKSHQAVYEMVKKAQEHVPYAPWQFNPDYFIPDLSGRSPKYHWGCPPPINCKW